MPPAAAVGSALASKGINASVGALVPPMGNISVRGDLCAVPAASCVHRLEPAPAQSSPAQLSLACVRCYPDTHALPVGCGGEPRPGCLHSSPPGALRGPAAQPAAQRRENLFCLTAGAAPQLTATLPNTPKKFVAGNVNATALRFAISQSKNKALKAWNPLRAPPRA